MGHPASLISVTPEVQTTLVESGQAFDFAFEVVMSPSLPTHLFHVKGLVLKNGSIGWALKKLFATPPCPRP